MRFTFLILMALLVAQLAPVKAHSQVRVALPSGRTAFQTNEWIDIAVERSGKDAVAPAPTTVEAATAGAPALRMVFPRQVPNQAIEHLRVNAALLRPGSYRLTISTGGPAAEVTIEVRSHVRRSSFRLIDWGSRATGAEIRKLGEEGIGFNTLYSAATGDDSILGGLDFLGCCVMSGGHQMDLRQECDWSDPYVVRGGTRRATRAALRFRRQPNGIGVHFYDEPGLTWEKDPRTGELTPHALPSQRSAYGAAFGTAPPDYRSLPTADEVMRKAWDHWSEWKLGFLDAAWRHARFGVDAAGPNLISANQSQYAWSAFTDGYYTTATRSLPIASGHGGYDDYGLLYFNPVFFLEMGRARDLVRPCWYLPTWYGNTTPDRYRLEQYLCFITGLQGMAKPPDMQVHKPGACPAEPAIVETNKVMARVGPIFAAMSPTRPAVALLYSLSNVIHEQKRDPHICYAHETKHGQALPIAYLAGQVVQHPFLPIVEEEVLDGTLRAHHRAIVLAGIDYLAPETIRAIEEFAAGGGVVVLTGDSGVVIRGAVRVQARAEMPDAAEVARLLAAKDYTALKPYVTIGKYMAAATKLGQAIAPVLGRAGVRPLCVTPDRSIVARSQRSGDIEYLFLVNATSAPTPSDPLAVGQATTPVRIDTSGRAVYDVLASGPPADLKAGPLELAGTLRMRPGEMRAFALTSRPIAGVSMTAPLVRAAAGRGETAGIECTAFLVDSLGAPFTGSAPLEIRLSDPAGAERYFLYRATNQGMCRIELPLAANDAPGKWSLAVRELLSGRRAMRSFEYVPAARVGASAGLVRRAKCLDADRAAIYRFVRNTRVLSIVPGEAPWCQSEAERIVALLKPWGIEARIVPLFTVNRARTLSADEARTWCGIDYAASGTIKPGDSNPPGLVGYNLAGPAILLGNPENSPLIKELQRQDVLPYSLGPLVPGQGRGLLAWERDILAPEVETVSLVATDADGLAEATGSFYEIACGLGMVDELALPIEAGPVRRGANR